jgi:hypothetical protein
MYKILAITLSAGSGLLVAPGIYGVIWFEHFGDRFNKTPFWAKKSLGQFFDLKVRTNSHIETKAISLADYYGQK